MAQTGLSGRVVFPKSCRVGWEKGLAALVVQSMSLDNAAQQRGSW